MKAVAVCFLVVFLGLASGLGLDSTTSQLVTRVCDIPSLRMVPGILRRPLAQVAVKKGLPLIDEDETLRDHILAGRTGHPVFITRLASALDEALDLEILTPTQQSALSTGVATVLLTPSAASKAFFERLDEKAIALAPTLRREEDRVALATAINDAIDIPFMSEEKEQVLFEGLVDSASDLLDKFLPGELQEAVLEGTAAEQAFVRAQLISRLEPQIMGRLPMGLLARVDAVVHRSNLTALPNRVAVAAVDATLGYVREKRPDEMLSPAERRARLAAREVELRAECERVEAEAASVISELKAQISVLQQTRREIGPEEEEEEGMDPEPVDGA